ncbi:MAG: Rne/Rng family ribonuclease [Gemmatimonadota bacterium]
MSASPEETWVALVEDGQLVELMFDRPDQGRIVGDIYLGKVEAVLPGIQAAFVDIGTEKAGFLHVSDVQEDDDNGNGGSRPDIKDLLKRGQEILVQVTKEPIGTKGPRITAQVSLPGRFLVYIPGSSHVGVSRKIEDRDERRRLKELASELLSENGGGLIVRTVGEELDRKAFERDFHRLRDTWKEIEERSRTAEAPVALHREAKLISGVIRDLFSDKFDSLTVNSKEIYQEIRDYLSAVDPDLVDRVQYYEGVVPLFDEFGIEEEIQQAFQRSVDLPSGGHIVIEPTEALVSIDVNTGRYTGKGKKDPEKVIVRTNLEAAREIARQLRLRDVGGIIVADFIDMESQDNRDRVLHELKSHLGRDRARTKAFEVSELGLLQMTRQRVRPSLHQALTRPCEHCNGLGRVYTPRTVVRRVERSLRRAGIADGEKTIEIRVHPEVALEMLESETDFLGRISSTSGLDLDLTDDPLLREDEFRLLSGPAKTDVTDRYARR